MAPSKETTGPVPAFERGVSLVGADATIQLVGAGGEHVCITGTDTDFSALQRNLRSASLPSGGHDLQRCGVFLSLGIGLFGRAALKYRRAPGAVPSGLFVGKSETHKDIMRYTPLRLKGHGGGVAM